MVYRLNSREVARIGHTEFAGQLCSAQLALLSFFTSSSIAFYLAQSSVTSRMHDSLIPPCTRKVRRSSPVLSRGSFNRLVCQVPLSPWITSLFTRLSPPSYCLLVCAPEASLCKTCHSSVSPEITFVPTNCRTSHSPPVLLSCFDHEPGSVGPD